MGTQYFEFSLSLTVNFGLAYLRNTKAVYFETLVVEWVSFSLWEGQETFGKNKWFFFECHPKAHYVHGLVPKVVALGCALDIY
jgi:hypothetical protein